jgi:hypothetical protein
VKEPRSKTITRCPACGTARIPGESACRLCDFPLSPGPKFDGQAATLVEALEQSIAAGDDLLAEHAGRIAEWREFVDAWTEYEDGPPQGRGDSVFEWALEASRWNRTVVGAKTPATKAAVARRFEQRAEARRVGEQLVDAHVHFIGRGPFLSADLAELSGPSDRWTIGDTGRDPVDIVVVGRSEAGSSALKQVLWQPGGAPRVFTQEAFIDLLLFGHEWWSDPARIRVAERDHQGLAAAHFHYPRGARWPADEPSSGTVTEEGLLLDGESELHRLGYQISGMSRDARWRVLRERAVPTLGVAVVRRTIERHIALRRGQWAGESRYEHALREWEHDLERLTQFYS